MKNRTKLVRNFIFRTQFVFDLISDRRFFFFHQASQKSTDRLSVIFFWRIKRNKTSPLPFQTRRETKRERERVYEKKKNHHFIRARATQIVFF